MNEEEKKIIVEHRETGKLQDSISIGTSGKGGEIKAYGDFSEPEAFKQKIDEAVKLRAYFNEQLAL